MSSGTITTTGNTSVSPTQSKTTASAQSVNVLGGLVTAGAVTAASASSNGTNGLRTSAAGTSFANLKVLGLPVLLSPAPNTRMTLPGVGYVVLNEQTAKINASSASLRVNAIRAVVTTPNLLGFDVGTTVVVSQAYSALNAPAGGSLGGFAYGTSIKAGSLLSSAPTFKVTLPCAGTNGVLTQRNGAGIDVPGLLDSGTIRNTAVGSTTTTTASGETTSTIESASLLDGLVEATGVRSVATASVNSGGTTKSSNGTTFATITVNGQPLVIADIKPNTRINLAGVGTLYLHRTITTATSIEVRAIEIVVRVLNRFGLPVGSVVQVAVAKAVAR
ncbi:MAG: hypothetical protein H0V67_01315 [Geodermatophilaceae bacterium]|nr:hypothetical protein [Geodermatophilaceae bacterium]